MVPNCATHYISQKIFRRWSCYGITAGCTVGKHFTISLEALLPTIKKYVAHWKRYDNDTHVDIYPSKMKYAVDKLTGHHPNPLSANPTKWPNTFKKFVGKSRRIVIGYFTGLELKGLIPVHVWNQRKSKNYVSWRTFTRKRNNKLVQQHSEKLPFEICISTGSLLHPCIWKREYSKISHESSYLNMSWIL